MSEIRRTAPRAMPEPPDASGRSRAVVFAGGGTGGHLMPGIAVADELRALDPSLSVLFMTRSGPVEERILRERGLPLRRIQAGRLSPAGVLRLAAGTWQSLLFFLRHPPVAVVGLGGYVSAGPLLAARILGRPVFLMEQNAVVGRVNRHFAANACALFLPWEFPGAARRQTALAVGNPVRRAIRDLPVRPVSGSARTVLVLGGSQGSQAVNEIVRGMLPALGEDKIKIRFLHVAGAAERQAVEEAYRRQGVEAQVRDFVDAMERWYAEADVAIARAGGTTLAELAAAGIPALLIPLPSAAEDHQRANARVFVQAGAAIAVEEGPGAAERCLAALCGVLRDPQTAARMSRAARQLAKPRAAAQIASMILEKVNQA